MSVKDGETAENGTMLPSGGTVGGSIKHSDYEHKCVTPSYEYSMYDLKRHRPLPLRRKIFEFYTAPITKFLANSVSTFAKILPYNFGMLLNNFV